MPRPILIVLATACGIALACNGCIPVDDISVRRVEFEHTLVPFTHVGSYALDAETTADPQAVELADTLGDFFLGFELGDVGWADPPQTSIVAALPFLRSQLDTKRGYGWWPAADAQHVLDGETLVLTLTTQAVENATQSQFSTIVLTLRMPMAAAQAQVDGLLLLPFDASAERTPTGGPLMYEWTAVGTAEGLSVTASGTRQFQFVRRDGIGEIWI